MFDVIWTDPNRELIGERIIRKELEKSRDKEKDKKTSETGRQSMSTTSSSASERGFGFFGSKRARKSSSSPRAKSLANSPNLASSEILTDKRSSAYGVRAFLFHQGTSDVTVKRAEERRPPVPPLDVTDVASSLSSQGSVGSKCTQPTGAAAEVIQDSAKTEESSAEAESSKPEASKAEAFKIKSDHLLQTLGPSSFVTRSTEISVAPRDPGIDIDQLILEVHISSDRTKAATPPVPELSEEDEENPVSFERHSCIPTPFSLPQTPPPNETPGLNVTPINHGSAQIDKPVASESWKPPQEWECSPAKEITIPSSEGRLQVSPTTPEQDHYTYPGLSALSREVKMMSITGPDVILAKVKAPMGNSADAMVYKELEMSKKRWMFSAMHQNGEYANLEHTVGDVDDLGSSRAPRVLALYETATSASFLAALYPRLTLSHLSTNPLSPNLFPNVQPIMVPSVTVAVGSRSLPPRIFSAVTSLSMASLFPSTDIPLFLRQVNRCLVPGGALHLTIMDPQPVSTSMGPKMRQWLFDRLLINLEQSFRTTYPSGTFPAWLAVAKLRGMGSTIATVTVPAVPEHFAEKTESTKPSEIRKELRCEVSRMLWQEIWGSFVHADRWWWDEEDIVQECLELGTFWQYSHIVAVKESPSTPQHKSPTDSDEIKPAD